VLGEDPPDQVPDDELVRRIEGGRDPRAEAALCRRFAPRIRLYGLRHLRDEDRAGDLVQTVLLGVIEACRAGRVQQADRIDRFILGTCRNAAARMREVEGRVQLAGGDELAQMVLAESGDVEVIDRRTLVRCLSGLDPRAARVLALSFQEERSADEIASLLAMEPGNVRVVRHRALASLRHCFDREAS
jgi:RNA polymerase sigma-70 factor (ECF subfamily)